jgi:KaiC/GvpD/RAD55 family RecA-like ATPase/ABC-type glycerol-3-phosphate transport system substrate-binding protein
MTTIKDQAASLTEVCGSYTQAVDMLTAFSRRLWTLTFDEEAAVKVKGKTKNYKIINESLLHEAMAPLGMEVLSAILNSLHEKNLYFVRAKEPGSCFKLPTFLPFDLSKAVLGNLKPPYETRYFVMRSIRKHYGAILSADTAHLFHLLARAVNKQLAAEEPKPTDEMHSPRHVWGYKKELLSCLNEALEGDSPQFSDRCEIRTPLHFFMECCRAVGYLWPHFGNDKVTVLANNIDAEFLISNLFGLLTNIRGFDELFGGGGILLAEGDEHARIKGLNGRTILIIGRFGTGKTLLSLQLAVEVARKGGLAWVMPLEQTAKEYLYILESMRLLPPEGSIRIATEPSQAYDVLNNRDEHRGALIFLKTIKDSYDDFLSTFKENAEKMKQYPLRLICVDPINSIAGREGRSLTHLRAQFNETIDAIEKAGTNVMLVAEEERDIHSDTKTPGSELSFEEKVADTVIHLTVNRRHEYAQRYFEITKSRLQREQRGVHAFSISPGVGCAILPSTAAVRAKMRPRSYRLPKTPVSFGLPSLDAIMGQKGVLGGDVIVLHGPEGSLKKSLGLIFSLNTDSNYGDSSEPRPESPNLSFQLKPVSLVLSGRDSEFTYRHTLKQEYIQNNFGSQQQKRIRIVELQGGYINPGYIFQAIDDVFAEERAKNHWVDRVMVDGIAHWEMSCPFIRDDETFADTLVDYLRRRGVTSLLICEEQSLSMNSALQRPIIDNADCVIQFDRFEFRGKHRVMLKVLKSRGMMHRRESFDLSLNAKALEVNPSASLLRVMPSGQIEPIKVNLYLHSETTTQKKIYNQSLLSQVKSVLSPGADIVAQERVYMTRESSLASVATVDELQVYQLDEFQLPDVSECNNPDFPLHIFGASNWDDKLWGDLVPRLAERVRAPDGSFIGLPYYENLSLLAFRKGVLDEKDTASWENLAKACKDWEEGNSDPHKIFFDFPKVTVENYTCLFWEILLSFEKLPERTGQCRLRSWLRSPAVVKAGKIYRQLCRRAHLAEVNKVSVDEDARNTESSAGQNDKESGEVVVKPLVSHQYNSLMTPIDVNTEAVVWRHWYSTLNQMMSRLKVEERAAIKIISLPQGVTIAGEWFWGIPSHSAAPEIGLEIIKLLTKHDAELDRLHLGIGLPTRSTFYDSIEKPDAKSNLDEVSVSPFFSMDAPSLKRLVGTAFRRSDFGCYARSFSAMAHYLQKIIELPNNDEQEIERGINHCFNSFDRSIDFARPEWQCNKCRLSPHGGQA